MDTVMLTVVAIAVAFIWVGMILSISFLEAWLKFRAPGVTIAIGLGIGRLVFGVLNKIEWLLAVVIAVSTYMRNTSWLFTGSIALLTVIGVLIIQTAWLLPALDKRAQRVINNQPVKASRLHLLFVAAELIKIALLFTMGLSFLNDL